MYRGLLKYYVIVIVSLFSAILLADFYFKRQQTNNTHQVPLQAVVSNITAYCQLHDCGQTLPFENTQLLDLSDIALPNQTLAQLASGKAVQVSATAGTMYYYVLLNTQTVIELGPYPVQTHAELDIYTIVFFSLLGITVLLMLWPLFSEMWRIKEAAQGFVKHKELSKLQLNNVKFFKPVSDTLNWMLNKIARLLALQMELTSTLSHELKTNIANLKFTLANLNTDNINETKWQLRDDVNEIQVLLDQYLSFAKQEHETPELDLQPEYLSLTIEDYLNKVSQFSDKQVSFDIHDDIEVMVDPVFYSRAIKNILDNAYKYTKSKIAVQLFVEDEHLVMQVDDDGHGLNADTIDELFIPFTRQSETQLGYGLGLAITKKIMHWHKGEVTANKSDILHGACFQLRLPISVG